MFQGYTQEAFEFFMAIRFNNNRPFFQDNRDWYLSAVREPTLALTEDLADTALEIDPEFDCRGHKCVSRINRDIRFARDKSPYRDHIWLAFRRPDEEKGKTPSLYFELREEGGSYGMGFYRENRPVMDVFRRRMAADPMYMMELLAPLANFNLYVVPNSRIKPPEDLPAGLRGLYCCRSFYFEKDTADFDLIRSPELAAEIKDGFMRLKPLYQFIRECADEAKG